MGAVVVRAAGSTDGAAPAVATRFVVTTLVVGRAGHRAAAVLADVAFAVEGAFARVALAALDAGRKLRVVFFRNAQPAFAAHALVRQRAVGVREALGRSDATGAQKGKDEGEWGE